ncbi:MAG: hypothetical protein R3F60_19325 [bacterium]
MERADVLQVRVAQIRRRAAAAVMKRVGRCHGPLQQVPDELPVGAAQPGEGLAGELRQLLRRRRRIALALIPVVGHQVLCSQPGAASAAGGRAQPSTARVKRAQACMGLLVRPSSARAGPAGVAFR